MSKVMIVSVVTCLLLSGCAVKMSANPVTWTDEHDGYHARDLRGVFKGAENGQGTTQRDEPRVTQGVEPEGLLRGSSWSHEEQPRVRYNWNAYGRY